MPLPRLPTPAPPLLAALLVGVGGCAGALVRYGFSQVASWGNLPGSVGTLGANIAGCFAAGVLLGAIPSMMDPRDPYRLLLLVGVLGGLTTFSALSVETMQYAREGKPALAAAYVLGSVVLGLLCVWGGLALGARVGRVA